MTVVSPAPARHRPARSRRRPSAPQLLLAAGVVASLVVCIYTVRDGWFGVDAYNYFADRGGLRGEHTSVWAPYGGHWEPVVIGVYLVIWKFVGFSSYLPYVLPAILTHLAICVLMFGILRRLGHQEWLSLSVVWLLLFYGAAGEAYTSDAPVALTSALALGLGALFVLLGGDSRRREVTATALLLLALGCSVTSVVAIALVAIYLVGVRRLRTAALAGGIPTACFMVWFAVSGRTGGRGSFGVDLLLEIPAAVWKAVTVPLGDVSGMAGAGVTLTLVVTLATLISPEPTPAQRAVALAGLAAALLQLTLSAVANASTVGAGLEDAVTVGRYRYIVLVCLLPAVAVTVQWGLRRFTTVTAGQSRLVAALLAVAVLVASTIHGLADLRGARNFNVAVGQHYKDVLFGSVAAMDLGEKMLYFEGIVFMNGHDIEKLARPEAREHFPEDFRPTADQRFTAESALFVGVRDETMDLPAPAGVSSEDFTKPLSNKFGCRSYTSTSMTPLITMTSFEGGQIAVTSDSSTIRTRLTRDDLSSEPKAWAVTAGEPVYIATSAQLAQLDIAFDSGGTFRICRA
ncbi:hypothetical protein L2K70_08080 [Nocardioides KLBMP 9356]|uniref:Glycosyltransferase RgtA/B/C/D-like domain-containing protein n=1 Tax=Nocardioides potassii TaxID=2911371 RepID=A0ABS9HBY7_9ACTN|nr:hypothetical protein [Nocardioides potassii]MCF6377558.1 hypothetical protein [Nocardioides potassii]